MTNLPVNEWVLLLDVITGRYKMGMTTFHDKFYGNQTDKDEEPDDCCKYSEIYDAAICQYLI